jgi:uncharacterized protein (DUF302 family)
MERRTLVRLLGVTAVGGAAGCAEPDSTAPATDTATDARTETNMQQDTDATSTESDGTATETSADDDGLVTVRNDGSVDAVVDRIRAAIENSPLTLVTTVDHAANAASVEADLPPTRLLIFGNPAVGTPLMQASRSVAIDLPQKMLVWADDGHVKVTYNDPAYLARRHGIDGQDDRLQQISAVLDGLASGEN